MTYNSRIRALFAKYSSSVIMKFINTLPPPDVSNTKCYEITTEDKIKIVVWGRDNRDVERRFADFLEVLIFH